MRLLIDHCLRAEQSRTVKSNMAIGRSTYCCICACGYSDNAQYCPEYFTIALALVCMIAYTRLRYS